MKLSLHTLKKQLEPLFEALDTFTREPNIQTSCAPHVRDSVDLKRWMMLVVVALFPCTLMAIWNTGLLSYVYGSANTSLYLDYLQASTSLKNYFVFTFQPTHLKSILFLGCKAYLPIMIITYAVGGFWEGLFACIRRHPISEGFLVTGMLISLILPPTIPYWMLVVCVSAGIVIGKELFGGTGMNILNPALVARCFLFFSFPNKMTGDVWIGTNSSKIQESIQKLSTSSIDAVSQSSPLNFFNISTDVKKIHVDAIGAYFKKGVSSIDVIMMQFKKWSASLSDVSLLQDLSYAQLQDFLTSSFKDGGLGLSPDSFMSAFEFAKLKFSQGILTDWNFFFGNMIGSLGETSKIGIILGAVLLVIVGIASLRTMIAMIIGSLLCAFAFQIGSDIGPYGGAFNPAKYSLPAYKHLLLGGLLFGAVFMATEPVTSPKTSLGKWVYGLIIGVLVIVIRMINPAFPEGVMLAILFGNVITPLIDNYALNLYRKIRYSYAKKLTK